MRKWRPEEKKKSVTLAKTLILVFPATLWESLNRLSGHGGAVLKAAWEAAWGHP